MKPQTPEKPRIEHTQAPAPLTAPPDAVQAKGELTPVTVDPRSDKETQLQARVDVLEKGIIKIQSIHRGFGGNYETTLICKKLLGN